MDLKKACCKKQGQCYSKREEADGYEEEVYRKFRYARVDVS